MSFLKKLPSYERLLSGATTALSRFPLALLSAILGTGLLVRLIEIENGPPDNALIRLILPCALGVPLFIALAAFAENRQWKRAGRIVVQGLGVALLIIYYLSLPANPVMPHITLVRFALLLIALHFMAAFLPFTGAGQANGFWQYNKSLFLRFISAALYSAVMFIGLAFALLAARELFGLKFPDRRYFQLWVIITGIFNTWIFLAGVPRDLRALNDEAHYPNGLKIFTQYILLPLVGLYLVILYAYELKIIINWNWPKGWVSQLVSWFSAAGILSLLLLWPLRELTENRWIRTYTRWFFRALIPLIVMLYLAILQRVGVYGITINRFLVLALATGLAIVTLYFVFTRKKDIRLIPVIIFVVAMLCAYGPWNAFTVARQSQQARLGRLLAKSGIVADGKIAPKAGEISFDDRGELSDVVTYLTLWHGVNSFAPWIGDSTLSRLESSANGGAPDSIAAIFGFEFIPDWRWQRTANENIYYTFKSNAALDISGYDHLFVGNSLYKAEKDSSRIFIMGDDTCRVRLNVAPPVMMITLLPQSKFGENLTSFALTEPVKSLSKRGRSGDLPDSALIFETNVNDYGIKAIVNQISAGIRSDSIDVNSISAYILVRDNRPK